MFLFLFEGSSIIRRWGSGNDATNGVWGIPRFRDIPLGSTKVPSSSLLALLTSGLLNLQRREFLLSF